MRDCLTNHPDPAATSITAAQSQLDPLLVGVIDALAGNGNAASFFAAGAFVQNLLERLRGLEQEGELPRLFLDISLIGCQGFELSDQAELAVDSLLVACESMALGLTAGPAAD
jgi:hypothetical protein